MQPRNQYEYDDPYPEVRPYEEQPIPVYHGYVPQEEQNLPVDLSLNPEEEPVSYETEYVYSEQEIVEDEDQQKAVKKMLHTISIIAGIVVIVVCLALLIGLIGWVRKDVSASLLLIQSGMQ